MILEIGTISVVTGPAGTANITDQLTEGNTNLFFTVARALGSVLGDLTGLIQNTAISATDTIKQALGKLQGQINDLVTKVTFLFPETIAFTTEIPFNKALTIVTGKTMNGNETFTAASNPVEGAGAQTWLIGNGTIYAINFAAFDRKSGDIDFSAGIKNLITMEYIGGEAIVSIINMLSV